GGPQRDIRPRLPQRVVGHQVEASAWVVALAYHDSAAVRRPHRLQKPPALLVQVARMRHFPRMAAIGSHQPEVEGAVAVAHEDNAAPVRREPRLVVRRHAARDPRGATASHRNRVEVAEQVEHDSPPVRRDVHRHPGSLVRFETDVAGGLEGEAVRLSVETGGRACGHEEYHTTHTSHGAASGVGSCDRRARHAAYLRVMATPTATMPGSTRRSAASARLTCTPTVFGEMRMRSATSS